MAKELWQAYHENGLPLAEPYELGADGTESLSDKSLAGFVQLWLWRQGKNGVEVLLAKRSKHKRTWSGYWDVAGSGHINFAERPIDAAIRETFEEIGVQINYDDVSFVATIRHLQPNETKTVIKPEIQWIFAVETIGELATFTNNDEVEAVAWHSLDDVEKALNGTGELPFIKPDFPHHHAINFIKMQSGGESH